jgi:hypothetical protein
MGHMFLFKRWNSISNWSKISFPSTKDLVQLHNHLARLITIAKAFENTSQWPFKSFITHCCHWIQPLNDSFYNGPCLRPIVNLISFTSHNMTIIWLASFYNLFRHYFIVGKPCFNIVLNFECCIPLSMHNLFYSCLPFLDFLGVT